MKYLQKYLDSVIRDSAKKSRDGYILTVDKLDESEKERLLTVMFEHDEATREFFEGRVDQLLDERISLVESEDNYEAGFIPLHDSQTGDVRWIRRPGGY